MRMGVIHFIYFSKKKKINEKKQKKINNNKNTNQNKKNQKNKNNKKRIIKVKIKRSFYPVVGPACRTGAFRNNAIVDKLQRTLQDVLIQQVQCRHDLVRDLLFACNLLEERISKTQKQAHSFSFF